MAVNIHQLKRWTNMMLGKSIYHVNQGVGKYYSINSVEGYYNDLTEKVIKGNDRIEVPVTIMEGEKIYFSIAIFQYGLGAYDLFLSNRDENMLKRFLICADWAIDNQTDSGAWSTFFYKYKDKHPYSSMAQGEGVSLLLRAYLETKDDKYLFRAKKAIDFMLLPLSEGGTTLYEKEDIFLYEYPHEPLVLNGWIFSLWGLYDYIKVTKDTHVEQIYQTSLNTLRKSLQDFELGYWSKYNNEKMITSPFYHKLHISQLKALYDITKVDEFQLYSDKWEKYNQRNFNRYRAFIAKALQKVIE